jgi:uncharacterized membrane protein HdeD (DUF308 family)
MDMDMGQRTGWGEPGLGLRRLLRQEASRWWWVPLVAGVAWFVVAWAVLRADATSLATVGVLVGVAFLLAAVNEAALGGLARGGWSVAHYVLGAVFVLGAAWAFVRPIDTFFALASVLGLILLLQGALYFGRGIALRDVSPYWGLEVLAGALISLLGVWVSVSDRVFDLSGRTAFILLWVGFMALFRGVSDIVLGFSMLWYSKRGDDRELDRPSARTSTDRSGQIHPSSADRSPQGRPEAPAGSKG